MKNKKNTVEETSKEGSYKSVNVYTFQIPANSDHENPAVFANHIELLKNGEFSDPKIHVFVNPEDACRDITWVVKAVLDEMLTGATNTEKVKVTIAIEF